MKPPSGRRKIFLFDTRVAYRRRGDSSLRSAKVILARARARACARERERERERERSRRARFTGDTQETHTGSLYGCSLVRRVHNPTEPRSRSRPRDYFRYETSERL